MQNVLKRNFLLISIFVLLNRGSHCPCTPFPPGRQLALSAAPACQACCQHTLSAVPLFCSHINNALLFLGFVFCNHYPIAAWEVESLVSLGKKPNNIALNAPSCDLVLSFHLLGKFKCNIQTSRAKFTPCHWYSKDNFLRSGHLSKLISWLNFSFHSLDPCTPYIWVLFSSLLKAPSGTAVPWKPCGTPVQRQMHVTHTEIHVKPGTEWSEVWSIKGSL